MSYTLYSQIRKAKEESYKSSCVLVKMPEEISKELDKFSKKMISDEYVEKREDEYHITILYGINDTLPDETIEILKENLNTSTFKIRFGAISKFYKNDNDVIKIDINDYTGKLEQAFQLINDNIENENKYEDYHPHCTLAYVTKGACEHLIGNTTFEGREITLSELKFSSPEEENTLLTTFGKKLILPGKFIRAVKKQCRLFTADDFRKIGEEHLRLRLLSNLPKPWTFRRETVNGDKIYEVSSDSTQSLREEVFGNSPYDNPAIGDQYDIYRGVQTEDKIFNSNGESVGAFHSTINCITPIVKYLLDQEWGLEDAILLSTNLCEDCLNICLEELDGSIYNEVDWADTHCEYCETLKNYK